MSDGVLGLCEDCPVGWRMGFCDMIDWDGVLSLWESLFEAGWVSSLIARTSVLSLDGIVHSSLLFVVAIRSGKVQSDALVTGLGFVECRYGL